MCPNTPLSGDDRELETWQARLLASAPCRDTAERVVRAIEELLSVDAKLLELDVNERALSHRLGCHMRSQFPDWDVDCEYNRDGHDPKRLNLDPIATGAMNVSGDYVYPDIIVHRRDTSNNHLVIEMKKASGAEPDHDFRKLRAYRAQLRYAHALFLELRTGSGERGLGHCVWNPSPQEPVVD